MEWKTIWIILIFLTENLNCQNLVENGSFEIFSRNVSFMHFGTDTVFPNYWENSISFGSPDFYRRNSLDKRLDVPSNWYGYHPARNGKAYIGMYPFCMDGTTEHLLGTFKTPLLKGKRYKFSLNLRFAGNCCAYYIKRIEVMLVENSDILYEREGFSYQKFTKNTDYPQIIIEDKNILQDTSWVLFEKDILINKPYKYFVLGVFYQHEVHFQIIKQINNYRNTLLKRKKNKEIESSLLIPNLNFRFDCTQHEVIKPYYFFDDISLFEIRDD